jgi:hypothetical protein
MLIYSIQNGRRDLGWKLSEMEVKRRKIIMEAGKEKGTLLLNNINLIENKMRLVLADQFSKLRNYYIRE